MIEVCWEIRNIKIWLEGGGLWVTKSCQRVLKSYRRVSFSGFERSICFFHFILETFIQTLHTFLTEEIYNSLQGDVQMKVETVIIKNKRKQPSKRSSFKSKK